MTTQSLPQRSPRLSDELQERIVRLSVQQLSQAEIARRLGVPRHAVQRVLRRFRSTLALTTDTSTDRAEAVALLRELQRVSWMDMDAARARGKPTAPYLAEIRLSQMQINALLGVTAERFHLTVDQARPPGALDFSAMSDEELYRIVDRGKRRNDAHTS